MKSKRIQHCSSFMMRFCLLAMLTGMLFPSFAGTPVVHHTDSASRSIEKSDFSGKTLHVVAVAEWEEETEDMDAFGQEYYLPDWSFNGFRLDYLYKAPAFNSNGPDAVFCPDSRHSVLTRICVFRI